MQFLDNLHKGCKVGQTIKRLVHPKMKMLSFTHPCVFPTHMSFFLFCESQNEKF